MYAHGLFQLKNTPVKSFMKLQIFSKKLAPIGIGDPFLESKGKWGYNKNIKKEGKSKKKEERRKEEGQL